MLFGKLLQQNSSLTNLCLVVVVFFSNVCCAELTIVQSLSIGSEALLEICNSLRSNTTLRSFDLVRGGFRHFPDILCHCSPLNPFSPAITKPNRRPSCAVKS